MPEPGRPSRRGQTSRDAILRATSELIADHGVDGFTITDIARRANLNRALVYHYYQNKDNLVAQSIDYLLERYNTGGGLDVGSIERSIRVHIEHPEIARVFFQLLLTGRPLPTLGKRITNAIAILERAREAAAPGASHDVAFAFIMLVLAQLSWAFSREEFARLLGIPVTDADERYIAQMRWAAELGIGAMFGPAAGEALRG